MKTPWELASRWNQVNFTTEKVSRKRKKKKKTMTSTISIWRPYDVSSTTVNSYQLQPQPQPTKTTTTTTNVGGNQSICGPNDIAIQYPPNSSSWACIPPSQQNHNPNIKCGSSVQIKNTVTTMALNNATGEMTSACVIGDSPAPFPHTPCHWVAPGSKMYWYGNLNPNGSYPVCGINP